MTEMPTVKKIDALRKRKSIYLVSLQELIENKNKVIIKIPDDPEVAFNKVTRNILEKVRTEWRWPAGGAAIIIKANGEAFLLSLLRDKGAPTYGGHTTLSTGLGGCEEDLENPLQIGREAIEEIIIATPRGVIVPTFDIKPFGESIDIKSIVKIGADLRPETQSLPLIEASARIVRLSGEKEVRIVWKNKTSVCKGLVVVDKGVRGIDILQIAEIDLGNANLEDLKIFDGEIVGGNPLNRDLIVYKLDKKTLTPTGKIVGRYSSGKFSVPADGTSFPQTPVLQAVLQELAKE
ncbi:hypothetical protein KJ854_05920 [Patescibacteria group bacterium]|nr:hypothetical protein [Patescibacteria group bacterium]